MALKQESSVSKRPNLESERAGEGTSTEPSLPGFVTGGAVAGEVGAQLALDRSLGTSSSKIIKSQFFKRFPFV